MPGSFQTAMGGVPNTLGIPCVPMFMEATPPFEYPYAINGVTRDVSGNALASCALELFRTADNSVAALGTSDASGNYALGASSSIQHYLVAYKAGSPDVAGTTVNTLTGA